MNFAGRHFFKHAGAKNAFFSSRRTSQAFFFSQNVAFSALAKQIARNQLVAAKLQMSQSLSLGMVRSALISHEEQEAADSLAKQEDMEAEEDDV